MLLIVGDNVGALLAIWEPPYFKVRSEMLGMIVLGYLRNPGPQNNMPEMSPQTV